MKIVTTLNFLFAFRENMFWTVAKFIFCIFFVHWPIKTSFYIPLFFWSETIWLVKKLLRFLDFPTMTIVKWYHFFQAHLLIDGAMVTYGSLIYVLNFGVNSKWNMVLQENMNSLKKILSMSFEVWYSSHTFEVLGPLYIYFFILYLIGRELWILWQMSCAVSNSGYKN